MESKLTSPAGPPARRTPGGSTAGTGALALLVFAALVADPGAARAQALGQGIDISHCTTAPGSDPGYINREAVQCWVGSEGVRRIIVRAGIVEEIGSACSAGESVRAHSKQHLETLWKALREDGLDFTVDLYVWLHWPGGPTGVTTSVRDQVREAISLLHELDAGFPPLPFKPWDGGRLWLDLEETPPAGQSAEDTIGLIQEALGACEDGPDDPWQRFFPCGIYTRKSWWQSHTGDTTAFSTYPLWYALYDYQADFSDWYDPQGSWQGPFGGWSDPVAKQYSDDYLGHLCGAAVDYDLVTLGDLDGLATPTGLQYDLDTVPYSAVLTWDPVGGDPDKGPVKYQVIVQYQDNVVEYSANSDRVVTYLAPDSHYLWRVSAQNHYGGSEWARGTFVDGGRPNLRVGSIALTEGSLFEGLRTTAVAALDNAGYSHSGTFNVKWFYDGAEVGYGSHSSLAPFSVSQGNVRYDFTVEEGCHTLEFRADVDAHVSETSEFDNSASRQICVPGFEEQHPPQADLKVKAIKFTSPPVAGAPTAAQAELVNAGGVASGAFNVKWLLDGAPVALAAHPSLAPGALSGDTVRFEWTPTAGAHTLTFSADVDGTVAEGDETNNSVDTAVEASEPPTPADLAATRVRLTSAPRAGVRNMAVARLVNRGGQATGLVKVRWFLDGVQVGHGSHSSIPAGQAASRTRWPLDWVPTPGRHTLRFSADIENAVAESDELNNSVEMEVNVPGLPDLKVRGISFTSPPRAGVRTTAIARLVNRGQSASGIFNVKWFLDGVQVGYGSHASLAPGAVSSDNVRFDWTPTPGTHRLRFEADVDGHVSESKETNNAYTVKVRVPRSRER
jgi:hypothetical protein